MMERVPQPVREMLALLRESGHTPYLVGVTCCAARSRTTTT